jgi:hypothetical protein
MVKVAGGERHQQPDALLDLCRRHGDAFYVRQTAEWLRRNYPGSADELLPQLRAMYSEKKAAEAKAHAIKVRNVPQVWPKSREN